MKSAPWPEPPDLAPGEVHLWWVEVGSEDGRELDWLSAEERARSERFHQVRDRRCYVARQAALRGILAAYLDREPSSIAFAAGAHGKPYLAGAGPADLGFNLSHSEGRVLLAFARGREVGVDVEAVRILPDMESMAAQVFTPFERAVFEGLASAARVPAFFRGWTRKEAALKALGDGFYREPSTLHVGLAPSRGDALLRAADEPALAGYALADLTAPRGFAAALCGQGDDWRARLVCDWERGVAV